MKPLATKSRMKRDSAKRWGAMPGGRVRVAEISSRDCLDCSRRRFGSPLEIFCRIDLVDAFRGWSGFLLRVFLKSGERKRLVRLEAMNAFNVGFYKPAHQLGLAFKKYLACREGSERIKQT